MGFHCGRVSSIDAFVHPFRLVHRNDTSHAPSVRSRDCSVPVRVLSVECKCLLRVDSRQLTQSTSECASWSWANGELERRSRDCTGARDVTAPARAIVGAIDDRCPVAGYRPYETLTIARLFQKNFNKISKKKKSVRASVCVCHIISINADCSRYSNRLCQLPRLSK